MKEVNKTNAKNELEYNASSRDQFVTKDNSSANQYHFMEQNNCHMNYWGAGQSKDDDWNW